jgi:hypothetical protein
MPVGGLWLVNCYFAHDSLRFPALLTFCDAPSGRSFHFMGTLARLLGPGSVHSVVGESGQRESLQTTLHEGTARHTHPFPCTIQIAFVLLAEKWCDPGGFELPTFWFVAVRSTLPNLARGVANRTKSASWGKFPQPAFSFFHSHLPHFCLCFPRFALHFRDSAVLDSDCKGE